MSANHHPTGRRFDDHPPTQQRSKRRARLATVGAGVLLAVAPLAGSVGAAAPTAVPIDNAGFEAATLGDGAANLGIAGAWTAPGVQGEFNPADYQITGGAIEGENVAFSNEPGGAIGQVLTTNLEPGKRYTLSVQVGERKEGVIAGNRPYEVQLLAGGVVLASTSSPNQVFDGWVTATVVFDSAIGGAQVGTPLEIRLVNVGEPELGPFNGQQLLWDDVRLTAETLANPPTSKDDCKKGGWASFTDAAGVAYVNQGACVSDVASGSVEGG